MLEDRALGNPLEPFPLDGGRAGLGVFAPAVTTEAVIGSGAQPRSSPKHRAHIPTPPSPIEGEGFGERYAAIAGRAAKPTKRSTSSAVMGLLIR